MGKEDSASNEEVEAAPGVDLRTWFSWEGKNYSYKSVRGPGICGTQILLTCSKEFLKTFERSVGSANSTNLQNLLILERPDNQWLILSERDPKVASSFISRLNRWELKNWDDAMKTPDKPLNKQRRYLIVENQKFSSSQRGPKGSNRRNRR